jgi:hypothetical protein
MALLGVLLGVPDEPHLSLHLLPLKRFLILPPSISLQLPSPATSPHALPIFPAERLSPRPFQSPLDFFPSYILRHSSSPSRQQQALPSARPPPCRSLLSSPSSLFLSLSVLVLVVLITVREANSSTANISSSPDSDDCFESPLGESQTR